MPGKHHRLSLLGPALTVAACVGAVMLAFEAGKQAVFSGLSPWESHFLTIAFTVALATAGAYVVGRRFATLSRATADEEIAEERERTAHQMQLLIDSTTEGIYGVDLERRCTFLNRAMAEMIGFTSEEAMGKN